MSEWAELGFSESVFIRPQTRDDLVLVASRLMAAGLDVELRGNDLWYWPKYVRVTVSDRASRADVRQSEHPHQIVGGSVVVLTTHGPAPFVSVLPVDLFEHLTR